MGLIFENRKCAHYLCDEEFIVSNERKIFCSDRCRARHHALVNGEETEMFRRENNIIISNYRILKSKRIGQIIQRTELQLLGYKLKYCSRYSIDRQDNKSITYWCYNLGLKSLGYGFELVSI
jgi:hypothetical protein